MQRFPVRQYQNFALSLTELPPADVLPLAARAALIPVRSGASRSSGWLLFRRMTLVHAVHVTARARHASRGFATRQRKR